MPARKAIPNPLKQRLGVVKQIYEERPEVHRLVTDIVKEAAGVTEISESDRRPWEKWIGNLASMIGKADKRRRKGLISQAEFEEVVEKAREGFIALTHARDQQVLARQRKGQQTIARRKERLETLAAKTSEGAKVVAPKLIGGYVGVEVTPNRKAPGFPSDLEAQKRWVAQNAPYQQWLGVNMGNCLQFYRVNYVPCGAKHFKTQRDGGTLYAVLSKDGKPEAAILATRKGRIVDANGPGNASPTGLAQRAMLQLIDKMKLHFGKHQGREGNALGVGGADPRLEALFEDFADYWPNDDLDTRDLWMQRIRLAASQDGFEFEPALRKFFVYILVGSKKYSALASVKKTDYPKKREVEKVIVRVARLIQKGASRRELEAAARAAAAAAIVAHTTGNTAYIAAYTAGDAAGRAAHACYAPLVSAGILTTLALRRTYAAAYATGGAAGRAARATTDAALNDYAAALLYFVEQQAQQRPGRRRNPSSDKVPSLHALLGVRKGSKKAAKKTTKKTTSRATNPTRKPRSKSPTAAALKKECRRLWEHYCERPNKTRLKAVIKHCEKMAESTAKSVKEERARCMRSARREMKKLGISA